MQNSIFKNINKYLAFAFLLAFVFLVILIVFRDQISSEKIEITPQAATSSKTP